MSAIMVDLAQLIGAALPDWKARPRPPRTRMLGRFCRVEPVEPARHADELFAANQLDRTGRNWTYLFQEPFQTLEAYRAWLEQVSVNDDPLFHAIVDARTGKEVGVVAFMRIDTALEVIEV